MDACEFFLEQYHTVRSIVNNLFLKGMSDDQMRHQPKEGLNSMAWYLWHTALARFCEYLDYRRSQAGSRSAMDETYEYSPT